MAESTATVRSITEEDDGSIWVSFFGHDGYFQIPDSENRPAIKARLTEAHNQKSEVSFTYDKDLNILTIE